jgi:hypothetical protein
LTLLDAFVIVTQSFAPQTTNKERADYEENIR